MDTYRALHSPHRDCVSWEYLPRIQKVGQPALDIDRPLIHRLQELSSYLFFPESEIRDIFGTADVHKIIECSCGTCHEGKVTRNLAERRGLVDQLQERKLTILLAILVYIGHPYLFSWVALDSRVSDENLDAVTTFLRRDDNIKTSKAKIMLEDVEDFCRFYTSAVMLFQPPTIQMGGPTEPYGEWRRMPFLNDLPHDQGASGKVRKFDIHEDYLDPKIKEMDWYKGAGKVSLVIH